mmetsp:Transcript_55597/g.116322  ORF Transcript_55597/g.116322 Transcript_55597/m.116322 type:complete len:255 (-) Transcript_55597:489-1253(-)
MPLISRDVSDVTAASAMADARSSQFFLTSRDVSDVMVVRAVATAMADGGSSPLLLRLRLCSFVSLSRCAAKAVMPSGPMPFPLRSSPTSSGAGTSRSSPASRNAPMGPRPFPPLSVMRLVPLAPIPLTTNTSPSESTLRLAARGKRIDITGQTPSPRSCPLISSVVRVEALRSRNRAAHTPSSHSLSSFTSRRPPSRMAAYWPQPLRDVRDVMRCSSPPKAAQPATPSWFPLRLSAVSSGGQASRSRTASRPAP